MIRGKSFRNTKWSVIDAIENKTKKQSGLMVWICRTNNHTTLVLA